MYRRSATTKHTQCNGFLNKDFLKIGPLFLVATLAPFPFLSLSLVLGNQCNRSLPKNEQLRSVFTSARISCTTPNRNKNIDHKYKGIFALWFDSREDSSNPIFSETRSSRLPFMTRPDHWPDQNRSDQIRNIVTILPKPVDHLFESISYCPLNLRT